jgi:glycosyltransferase involved in cell wall biosynthesis
LAEPLVSVVIPVHDGERYLAEAIRSVLDAGTAELEVLVVDDGSTDATPEVARAFGPPVAYFAQPERSGAGAARNRGVELARGELLAFLDADDLWTPTKLRRQLEVLRRDPATELVFGHLRHFVSPELDGATVSGLDCPPDLQAAHVPGAMLVRSESFARVGGFHPEVRAGEALEWLLRARELGLRETTISDLVLWRRVHPASHTLVEREGLSDYARVLKAALDRRRARHPA